MGFLLFPVLSLQARFEILIYLASSNRDWKYMKFSSVVFFGPVFGVVIEKEIRFLRENKQYMFMYLTVLCEVSWLVSALSCGPARTGFIECAPVVSTGGEKWRL